MSRLLILKHSLRNLKTKIDKTTLLVSQIHQFHIKRLYVSFWRKKQKALSVSSIFYAENTMKKVFAKWLCKKRSISMKIDLFRKKTFLLKWREAHGKVDDKKRIFFQCWLSCFIAKLKDKIMKKDALKRWRTLRLLRMNRKENILSHWRNSCKSKRFESHRMKRSAFLAWSERTLLQQKRNKTLNQFLKRRLFDGWRKNLGEKRELFLSAKDHRNQVVLGRTFLFISNQSKLIKKSRSFESFNRKKHFMKLWLGIAEKLKREQALAQRSTFLMIVNKFYSLWKQNYHYQSSMNVSNQLAQLKLQKRCFALWKKRFIRIKFELYRKKVNYN